MTTKAGASAAAALDHPLTVTGMTTTKIAITNRPRAAAPRLAEPRPAAVQQVQRERGGDQDHGDDAQPKRIAVIGIGAGDLRQQHRHGGQRPDAADHRRRAVDQVAGANPSGQDQRQPATQEPLVDLLHVGHG